MLSLIRLISFRHLFDAKLRTILTILGVAVGVATMVGVTSINRSVLQAFRSTVDTIGGVGRDSEVVIASRRPIAWW